MDKEKLKNAYREGMDNVGTLEVFATESDEVPGYVKLRVEGHLPKQVAMFFQRGIKELIEFIGEQSHGVSYTTDANEAKLARDKTAIRKMYEQLGKKKGAA